MNNVVVDVQPTCKNNSKAFLEGVKFLFIINEMLLLFCRSRSLRTPPNMFIISMAISDMGFSAINGFPLMTISAFMKKWYFGAIGKGPFINYGLGGSAN